MLIRTVKVQSESPWFNDDIRAARKTRRQLERKWRDNGKREVHRQEYRKQHDIVKNMINQAKIAHYSSLVEESSGNQKKLFNIVKKLFHKPKTPVLPSAHSDQDIANAFANIFCYKNVEHPSFFPAVSAIQSQTQPHNDSHCILSVFEPTCVTEIKELIMKSPSKSCKLDPVPTSLIKQNIDVFAKYITIIVNISLSSGCFPDIQKVAHVKPLLKKPNLDKEVFKNYRPVANLKYLGKTIERVVSSRISDHVRANNLSDTFQSAYKPFMER